MEFILKLIIEKLTNKKNLWQKQVNQNVLKQHLVINILNRNRNTKQQQISIVEYFLPTVYTFQQSCSNWQIVSSATLEFLMVFFHCNFCWASPKPQEFECNYTRNFNLAIMLCTRWFFLFAYIALFTYVRVIETFYEIKCWLAWYNNSS